MLGIYAAAQNYNAYPVLSWPNIVSGITHSVSGFASLYILFSGMADMKKRNVPICLAILSTYCVLAFTANRILGYNYMFLEQGDGTPYDILYNLVGGNPILYPLCVVALFFLYITVFYLVYTAILRSVRRGRNARPFSKIYRHGTPSPFARMRVKTKRGPFPLSRQSLENGLFSFRIS